MPKPKKLRILTNGSGLGQETSAQLRAILHDRLQNNVQVEIVRLECSCGVESLWEVEWEAVKQGRGSNYTVPLECPNCGGVELRIIISESPDFSVSLLSVYHAEKKSKTNAETEVISTPVADGMEVTIHISDHDLQTLPPGIIFQRVEQELLRLAPIDRWNTRSPSYYYYQAQRAQQYHHYYQQQMQQMQQMQQQTAYQPSKKKFTTNY